MVTIAEIARQIGIPATTARDYVRRFPQYFPKKDVAGQRHPMYMDYAKDILTDITKGYRDGKSHDEIDNDLTRKYPLIVSHDDENKQRPQGNDGDATATSTSLTKTTQSSNDIITALQVQEFRMLQRLTENVEKLTAIHEENRELHAKVDRLEKMLQEVIQSAKSTNNRQSVDLPVKDGKTSGKRATSPQKEVKKASGKTETKQDKKGQKQTKKGFFSRIFG